VVVRVRDSLFAVRNRGSRPFESLRAALSSVEGRMRSPIVRCAFRL